MKRLLAIGLACTLPTGLAADDPNESDSFLGTVNVLVIEESPPLATDVVCARGAGERSAGNPFAGHCMSPL